MKPADASQGNRRIENVVFDMGNVLMTFDGLRFSRIFTESEDDARCLHAALFARPEWALLDAGAIGYDTMLRVAEASLPERLHPNLHECFERWHEHSEPIAETNALVPRLKEQGLGVYLLTNANSRAHLLLDRMPAWPLMDGCVVSALEHVVKPDPAIYALLCERYGLDPASCLFVDDVADNCRGAEEAGMRAFRYAGGDRARLLSLEIARNAAPRPGAGRRT